MSRARPEHPLSPPTEAQTKIWLAWLAQGMQRRGQVIFLLEQLQPALLQSSFQRCIYYLVSRFLWGLMLGTLLGLVFAAASLLFGTKVEGLLFFQLFGLGVGLFIGLVGGLLDAVRYRRDGHASSQNRPPSLGRILPSGLRFGALFGAAIGLVLGLTETLGSPGFFRFGWPLNLTIGLVLGMWVGPLWALWTANRDPSNEIRAVESIRLSRRNALRGSAIGLALATLVGGIWFLANLAFTLDEASEFGWVPEFAARWLKGALLASLVGGLASCIQTGVRELKTESNQGMKLSLRHGCLAALLLGGTGGLLSCAADWKLGLTVGAASALSAFLWFGGMDLMQHYLLRFLLWRAGAMPWHYADFLDYAAEELHFLQKVGGGYIFVHRYLLEHFAAMEPAVERRSPPIPSIYAS